MRILRFERRGRRDGKPVRSWEWEGRIESVAQLAPDHLWELLPVRRSVGRGAVLAAAEGPSPQLDKDGQPLGPSRR